MMPPTDPDSIPFNKPSIVGRELEYITEAVERGHLAGDGDFTRRCEAWLEQSTGATRVLLTHSCTGALEMASLLTSIGPGDEVILPSYTFVSTANAFVLRGARPVFVDIRPDTLNLDEKALQAAISERSKVIVPVHYAGVGCAMDVILELAHERGLHVIEDAAHAVDARWRGQELGTFGALGTFSFHETKNYISGEGGALLVNDPAFVERAETIRDKGTNRKQFFRREVDKYSWVDIGSSFLPSDMVAAFLLAQLEQSETIRLRRLAIFDRYRDGLAPLQEAGLLRLPHVPPDCEHNGHMFYLLTRDLEQRTALLSHLKETGIHAVFHYVPLHLSPMGRQWGYQPGDLPVTETLSDRLIRLPSFFSLTEPQQDRVIESVIDFFQRRR